MARPEYIRDVKDRWNRAGTLEVQVFNDQPALLKAAAAIMEAVTKAGGKVEKHYSSVDLELPKSPAELQQTLEYEQRHWDSMDQKYEAALLSTVQGDLNWEQRSVRDWAKEEGRQDPFIVSEIEELLK